MKEHIESGEKLLKSYDVIIDLWSYSCLHYKLIIGIDEEIEKAFDEAICQPE